MGTNKDRITGIIQKNTGFLRSEYNIKTIGIFGSISRGEEQKSSRQYLEDIIESADKYRRVYQKIK